MIILTATLSRTVKRRSNRDKRESWKPIFCIGVINSSYYDHLKQNKLGHTQDLQQQGQNTEH
ncbi:hypothetical protein HZS_4831 [Henneguya salminicola]|nr:hypothetical protein HZS_4831 [Henneguya salminicola]